MKNWIKSIGIAVTLFGLVLLFFNISQTIGSTTVRGEVTDILERKYGNEYISVNKGSESPCRLKIQYIDKKGENVEFRTTKEISPCLPILLSSYYKVGDQVSLLYKEDSLYNPLVKDDWYLLFPIVTIILGIVWYYLGREKNDK